MLLRVRLLRAARLGGLAQVFAEPANRVLVPVVLLVAAGLVEDIVRVVGIDVQVREDLDSPAGVSGKTGLLGGPLPRVYTCRVRWRRGEKERRKERQKQPDALLHGPCATVTRWHGRMIFQPSPLRKSLADCPRPD